MENDALYGNYGDEYKEDKLITIEDPVE